MDILRIFGIATDVFGLLLCSVELAALFLWYKMLDKSGRYLAAIFTANALSLLSNLLGLLFKGSPAPYAHGLLIAMSFCEFAFGYLLAFVFTMYVFHCIEQNGGKITYRKWIAVYCGFALVLLVISQFNGMYYYIDSANYYHRANLFFISQVFGIGQMVLNLILLPVYRKYLQKKEIAAMLIYILLPAAALVLQIFFYGVYLLLLAETIGIVIMFLLMLSTQVKRYYEKDKQISDMKALLMMSQIQPHFLYNSLAAIKHLCKTNPQEAADTVEEFSQYLRSNMNAIVIDHCIPFASEMNHVQNYLSLEKKRFGRRLQVSFDIKDNGFNLPPLTIQPIVENAVKYGTMQKMNGVSITVSSFSDESSHYILVSDNGAGFDTKGYMKDGKPHIGIAGVRSRLEAMCGGTLEITSTPDIGTDAVITIPKEGK